MLFKKFSNQKLVIKNIQPMGNNRYNVVTQIVDRADTTNASFIIVDKDSNYKVLDLVTEGVSLITSQRAEFNNILEAGGIQALIAKLQEIAK